MKKILIALSVLFIMSGCDANTKSLTCTTTNNATNGVTTKTTYDIDYAGDDVKYITITYDYNQDKDANDIDGVNSDTDGLEEDNDNDLDGDDIVDGIVGDVIDETVEGVTETILDIAGIRNNVQNQLSMYDDMEGFSYDVDVDTSDQYRIVYKIDMTKINDDDLANFNVTRNFNDIRTTYEDLGYTCK